MEYGLSSRLLTSFFVGVKWNVVEFDVGTWKKMIRYYTMKTDIWEKGLILGILAIPTYV